jgi:hypothetical protein
MITDLVQIDPLARQVYNLVGSWTIHTAEPDTKGTLAAMPTRRGTAKFTPLFNSPLEGEIQLMWDGERHLGFVLSSS